eukprot:TRINITY_DN11791_c0_g1_i1.p1 TRINITY_DN11791_c0_g1~~TRINITY_DN11791_c0_g1_i1.p1  ORF type:complete len:340 (-),score=103.90 TRINITY_DN11791_c0_g1_i1:104-1123(-)
MMEIDWDTANNRLGEHYDFFNDMLSLIPTEHYFPVEAHEEDWNKKFMRNKRRNQSKEAKKQWNQEKTQNQKKKLDPKNYKSVPEVLKDLSTKERRRKKQQQKANVSVNPDEVEVVQGFVSGGMSERDEIRRRLLDKINTLRKKRNASEAGVTDRVAKRRKVKETKQGKSKPTNKPTKKRKRDDEADATPTTKKPRTEDENIEFGTFDYSSGKPVPTYLAQKKKQPNTKILLQRAEARQRKLQELEGTEEGKKLEENQAWDSMIKRARGEKVKDDVKKLKKTIKRKEQKKARSKKKWEERIATQKAAQKKKQVRRERNINMRKKGGSRAGFEGKKRKFIN